MNKSELRKIKDVRWRRILELIFEEEPSTVLDIGCSSGEISSFLIPEGIKVFGIDIFIDKIEQAFKKGIVCISGDISTSFPYKSESFDLALAGEIIEHLRNTDYFLDEIHRVLKKSGKLVITVPNTANLENRLRLLIGRYPIFVNYTNRGDDHSRVYTRRALTRQLKERGFKVEVCTGSFVPPISYSLFKKAACRLMPILGKLGSMLPDLAIHTIVKAWKV